MPNFRAQIPEKSTLPDGMDWIWRRIRSETCLIVNFQIDCIHTPKSTLDIQWLMSTIGKNWPRVKLISWKNQIRRPNVHTFRLVVVFLFLDMLSTTLKGQLKMNHLYFSIPDILDSMIHCRSVGWICQLCGQKSQRKTNLIRHMISKHTQHQLICQFCDKTFTREDNRKLHYESGHGLKLTVTEIREMLAKISKSWFQSEDNGNIVLVTNKSNCDLCFWGVLPRIKGKKQIGLANLEISESVIALISLFFSSLENPYFCSLLFFIAINQHQMLWD